MKALIINGSPSKSGTTSEVLDLVSEKIKASNFSISQIRAYDCTVAPCRGCMACRPDHRCVLPTDDGHRLAEILEESDLLVVGTPSYWSGMPAPLKVLFDRNVSTLEYCLDKPPVPKMVGKKAVIVATCASDQMNSSNDEQLPLLIKNIQYILGNSGYEILGTIGVHSSWNFELSRESVIEIVNSLAI